MTPAAPPLTRHLTPAALVCLLPVCAAGLVSPGWGWWATLPLALALLGVSSSSELASISGLLLVLGGGLGALARWPDLTAVGLGGLLLTALGGLSLWGVGTLQAGRRRGLLLGAGLLLAAPSALGLLALGLSAVGYGAGLRRVQGLPPSARAGTVRAWSALALALASAGLLGWSLPQVRAPWPSIPPAAVAPTPTPVPGQPAPPPAAQPAARGAAPSPAAPLRPADLAPGPVYSLLMPITGLMLVVSALLLLRSYQGGRRRPRHWSEWLELAGLIAAVALFALLLSGQHALLLPPVSGLLPGGGGAQVPLAEVTGTATPDAAQVRQGTDALRRLTEWLAVLAFLFVGTLLGLLIWLRRGEQPETRQVVGAASPLSVPAAQPATLRVRRAWQQAEAHLDAAGWPRPPSETPAAYARRLTAQHPALSPLPRLSLLYQEVRYGDDHSDQQADEAEALSRSIQITPLPRPHAASGDTP